MENSLLFKTIKLANHDGFTLIEILVVLFVLSLLSLSVTTVTQLNKITHFQHKKQLELEIIQTQLIAIATHKKSVLPFNVANQPIYFNEFGNINQAISGYIPKYNAYVVFYLGFGRYEIK